MPLKLSCWCEGKTPAFWLQSQAESLCFQAKWKMSAYMMQDYSLYRAQVLITDELSYLSSGRAEEWRTEWSQHRPFLSLPVAERQFQYKTKQKAKQQTAGCNLAIAGTMGVRK